MVLRSMNSIFTRHGRWLFAIITLVIIVSFVGFLTPGFTSLFMGAAGGGGNATVGTAFGKKVTVTDIRDQARHGMFFMYMLSGGMFSNSQIYDYAEGEAFNQICQLAAAHSRGIVVAESEIAEFIEGLPMFRGNDGQFSIEKFRAFCKNFLAPNCATEEDLANAIRDGLILGKLYQQITGSVVVTPSEVADFYNELYEKFDVATVTFKGETFAGQIKVTPEELDAYFKAHQKEYNIPAQYKVKVIAFEYREFEQQNHVTLPEAALKKYYDLNQKEFEVKQGGKTVTQTFAQVKDTIRHKLQSEGAKNTAKLQGQKFATDVYKKIAEDENNRFKHFTEIAAANKRKITDIGWVSAASQPEAVFGEPALLEEITKIYIQIPISNPVIGEKAVYVAWLEEKKNSRPATLAEVKSQVLKAVQEQKGIVLAKEKARAAVVAIAKAEDKVAALKKYAGIAEVKNLEPFVKMNPPYGPEGNVISSLADTTASGNVSTVQDITGGAMFVLVKKRTMPAAKEFDAVQAMVSGRYKTLKQELAKQNFSRWLMSKCQNQSSRGNQ